MTAGQCPACGGALPPDDLVVAADLGVVQRRGIRVKLKRQQMVVLEALTAASPRLVTYDSLLCLLYDYGEREPDSALECLHVVVCQLRSKLRPLGVGISVQYSRGYTLEMH